MTQDDLNAQTPPHPRVKYPHTMRKRQDCYHHNSGGKCLHTKIFSKCCTRIRTRMVHQPAPRVGTWFDPLPVIPPPQADIYPLFATQTRRKLRHRRAQNGRGLLHRYLHPLPRDKRQFEQDWRPMARPRRSLLEYPRMDYLLRR